MNYREELSKPPNRYLVDLDGTLAKTIWPKRGIGAPIVENVRKYMELVDRHPNYDFEIYTARPDSDRPAVKAWLKENKIPFTYVRTGKPLGTIIDDRSLHPDQERWYE